MKQVNWEYLTESADTLTADRLNDLGADRWELVAIHEGKAIFKRPGSDFRDRITIQQRQHLEATRSEEGG